MLQALLPKVVLMRWTRCAECALSQASLRHLLACRRAAPEWLHMYLL